MAQLTTIIQDKIDYNKARMLTLQREVNALEKQQVRASSKDIDKWLGNNFESSCSTTPEFASFAREFKRYIVKSIGNSFELVNFSRGHFYISGFLKNKSSDNLCYFSISDVRFFPDEWYNHVLIRTAKHERDYTGGMNNYTKLVNIVESAEKLTS